MGLQSKGLYLSIWRSYLPQIVKAILVTEIMNKIQLDGQLFKKAGDRKSYSFNLEIKNGRIDNNIGGSAVARDLETIITGSDHVKKLISEIHMKINMDDKFLLNVKKVQ